MLKYLIIIFAFISTFAMISTAKPNPYTKIINIDNDSYKIYTSIVNGKLYINSDDFAKIISGINFKSLNYVQISSNLGKFTFINHSLMYKYESSELPQIIQLNLPVLKIQNVTYLPFESLFFSLDSLGIMKVEHNSLGFSLKRLNQIIQYPKRLKETNENSDFVSYTLPELSRTFSSSNESSIESPSAMEVKIALENLDKFILDKNEKDQLFEQKDLLIDTESINKELKDIISDVDEEIKKLTNSKEEILNNYPEIKQKNKSETQTQNTKTDEKSIKVENNATKKTVDLTKYYPKTEEENKKEVEEKNKPKLDNVANSQPTNEPIQITQEPIDSKIGYIIPKNLYRKNIDKYLPKEYEK